VHLIVRLQGIERKRERILNWEPGPRHWDRDGWRPYGYGRCGGGRYDESWRPS